MSRQNATQTNVASNRPAGRCLAIQAIRLLMLAAALIAARAAQAQTYWTGAVDDDWREVGNWWVFGTPPGTPGSMPVNSTNVIFGAGALNTDIVRPDSDVHFRNLTHTGALDYSVIPGSAGYCYQFAGNITMTGEEGNGNLAFPYSGGIRLSNSAGATITNNSEGAFTAHNLRYQVSDSQNRVVTIDTGIAAATATIGSLGKRRGYSQADLLKTGPGVLTITGVTSYTFSTTGDANSGLTGKVAVTGGTLRITSGNEDSLGRFNAGAGPFAGDVLTLDGGTLQVSTNSLTIDDTNRGITLGAGGGGFNVDAGLTLVIGSNNVITGPGSLTKTGAGTLTLQAANTYVGTTTVQAGLLNVTGMLPSNGLGDVLISSAGTSFEANYPRIARYVPSAFDFSGADWGSSILGGNHATTAELLAGMTSQDRTVAMAWREGTQADVTATGRELISDVLLLEGTGPDSYVLQMSYNPLASYAYLAWLDGDYWVNAVEGNTEAAGSQAVGGYAGSWADFTGDLTGWSLDTVLGSYGFDAANSVAWAVLDHNSQFAVVPEPGTWLMLLSLLACGLVQRRRR